VSFPPALIPIFAALQAAVTQLVDGNKGVHAMIAKSLSR
jgi:hypothetical protein